VRSGIALGSNVGDRLANIRGAIESVRALHEPGTLVFCSSIYETAPIDCEPASRSYFNAVMEIDFVGTPTQLLGRLRSIESTMGRPKRRPRNAPRTIDLDILYMGHLRLNEPQLILPHPRMLQRRFVLVPLEEILPGLILLGQRRDVRMLLADLPDLGEVTKVANEDHARPDP
jgi:2-amino-4-hydroxy-6-hydroxymethyldihydropteridine diphosphokinase